MTARLAALARASALLLVRHRLRASDHTRDRAGSALRRLCAARTTRRWDVRLAVVVAHPDDEAIGAASRLPWLPRAIVVQTTDGAPRGRRDALAAGCASREAYARRRAEERARALALAGIGPDRMACLGVPDQRASLALVKLTLRLAALLDAVGATVVLTHPYEGGHPDHDATAFAVHAAARHLTRHGRAPVVLELTSYHLRGGRMATGCFPPDGSGEGEPVRLSDEERALKRRMLECHASQRAVLAAFGCDAERFRVAPRYDFTRPPRGTASGALLYERYEWGMTGARFRALARTALATLDSWVELA